MAHVRGAFFAALENNAPGPNRTASLHDYQARPANSWAIAHALHGCRWTTSSSVDFSGRVHFIPFFLHAPTAAWRNSRIPFPGGFANHARHTEYSQQDVDSVLNLRLTCVHGLFCGQSPGEFHRFRKGLNCFSMPFPGAAATSGGSSGTDHSQSRHGI